MRFLFCSLDSPGFLYPAIGLATALRDRGHQVAFVTDVGCERLLAGAGLERIPRGLPDGSSFLTPQWGLPLAVAIQVKHVELALERFPADALVGQSLTLGPLLVRERRRIPAGLLGLCTYLWPAGAPPAGSMERRVWRYRELLGRFNEARALFHLPPCTEGDLEDRILGDLFLLRSVPELETDHRRLPRRVHLAGDCLWEPDEGDPELEAWLDGTAASGVPLIYVQHGRFFQIPSFWPRLVAAMAGSGYRVASSIDRLDSDPGPLPEGFFVRPHLPQGRIIPRARAVVASANTTAVLGALTAGVPCLLIPGGGEQPDVAEVCVRAGVAKVLPWEAATPERIQEALAELLADARYGERAALCRRAFARTGRFEVAADLLERMAQTRKPVLRQAGGPRDRTTARPAPSTGITRRMHEEEKEPGSARRRRDREPQPGRPRHGQAGL